MPRNTALGVLAEGHGLALHQFYVFITLGAVIVIAAIHLQARQLWVARRYAVEAGVLQGSESRRHWKSHVISYQDNHIVKAWHLIRTLQLRMLLLCLQAPDIRRCCSRSPALIEMPQIQRNKITARFISYWHRQDGYADLRPAGWT